MGSASNELKDNFKQPSVCTERLRKLRWGETLKDRMARMFLNLLETINQQTHNV